jgi:pimeloyl-ACP methyl ester carboxylesterase
MHSIPYQPEKLIDTNSIQLNYDSFGYQSDPPILLIMGLATQMIYWDEGFCRMLAAQGFWVIRFDNRDVGKSTWFKGMSKPSTLSLIANVMFNRPVGAAYLLDDMVTDTIGLMDGLDIKQAHLVGASMGGMIAQTLAIKAPRRVISLTSIMSTTGNRSLPKPSMRFGLKVLSPPPKDEQAFLLHAMKIWQVLHGEHYEFEAKKISNLISRAIKRGVNLEGSGRQLAAIIDSPDRTLGLNSLDVPSLVIHGDADPLVPIDGGYATAKAIPNAQLKICKGMGHTIPSALYSDISQAIIELIRSTNSNNATT